MFMTDCAGPARAIDGGISFPEQQWPGGMHDFNTYLHSLGLKAGFYTDIGVQRYPHTPNTNK